MMDFTKTHTLLASVKELPPLHSFLLDRYFPTGAGDIFSTTDVLVEYKKGNKKAAPFVVPRNGGIPVFRDGYTMKQFTPAHIGTKRSLTIDDLQARGFGEALYSELAPAQRQNIIMLSDLDEMRGMNLRRKEAMAAEVIFTNGCVMHEYADDLSKYDEREVHYYDEVSNPAVYSVGSDYWATSEASGMKILNHLHAMVRMLASRGLPATEVIMAPDVADVFLANAYIQKLLDNRRIEIGGIRPEELPNGAAKIARINVKGRMLDILTYEDTYEEIDGTVKNFVPSKKIAVLAPGIGRTVYGAITQLEQTDGQFHTYASVNVPKYTFDAIGNTRALELNSAPLCIPNNANPVITAQVLA